jgi:hypothetical protein
MSRCNHECSAWLRDPSRIQRLAKARLEHLISKDCSFEWLNISRDEIAAWRHGRGDRSTLRASVHPGNNEGWIVEIWDVGPIPLATAKCLSGRQEAWKTAGRLTRALEGGQHPTVRRYWREKQREQGI